MAQGPTPTFFRTAAAFRAWLRRNHDKKTELWIGYFKKASGKGGMVYQEALDEALCIGWIDGIVKSIDGDTYMQRWTPRKKDSHWSLVNVRRFGELDAAGRIQPAGRAAYLRRTPDRTGKAAYEAPLATLTPQQLRKLKANRRAWAFFESSPAGYQRAAKYWITSAKQAATRERRLAQLIDCNANGKRLPQFTPAPPKGK